jgi:hypothetical protein
LYWYDNQKRRLLTPEELIFVAQEKANVEERQRLEAEERVKMLENRLKALGFEPETIV